MTMLGPMLMSSVVLRSWFTLVRVELRAMVRVAPCGKLLRTKFPRVLLVLRCLAMRLMMSPLGMSRLPLTQDPVPMLSPALVPMVVWSRLFAETRVMLNLLMSPRVRAFPLVLGVLSRMTPTWIPPSCPCVSGLK